MEYYEQLLEECSYLQIDYKRLDKMKHTLNIMKNKLKELGGKQDARYRKRNIRFRICNKNNC